eukprot:1692760-Rhodomonas_salina.1
MILNRTNVAFTGNLRQHARSLAKRHTTFDCADKQERTGVRGEELELDRVRTVVSPEDIELSIRLGKSLLVAIGGRRSGN